MSETPDLVALRNMRSRGMSNREIADAYGVSRQAIDYWARKYGLMPEKERYTHKDYIPWTVLAADHNDGIARVLRWYSKQQQGGEISDVAKAQIDKVLRFLKRENVVINYTEEDGWHMVPRNSSDAPGDIIRRPPGSTYPG